MIVVVAGAERPGPPARVPPPGRPQWLDSTNEPVGTQHAVALALGAERPARARCGVDITGWIIFANRPFDLGGAASCRRCAQLVSAPARRGWWTHPSEPLVRHHVPAIERDGAGTAVCLTKSSTWLPAPEHPNSRACPLCAAALSDAGHRRRLP